MKDEGTFGRYLAYGLDVDRGQITFMGIPLLVGLEHRNDDTDFVLAQLTVTFSEWLNKHPYETTVADLVRELDNAIGGNK